MGGLESRDLVRRLKDAPRALSKELRDEMKRAAGPAADQAKKAILRADSRHPGSLRANIAATVSVTASLRSDTGAQVTILSDGKKMPPGQQNLPAYADASTSRYSRWRHPVFGDRERWVDQRWPSARGWFARSIRDEVEHFTEAAERACDKVAAKLEEDG